MLAEKLAKFRAKPDTINTKDKDRNRKAPKFKDSYRNSARLFAEKTPHCELLSQCRLSFLFALVAPNLLPGKVEY
jgi:hypothetical protein